MCKVYGYARISTMKQNLERQRRNIKKLYPNAVMIEEKYTGTTMERPQWKKLEKQLKRGDTVVCDEVSRMARSAEEGFRVYQELYNRGVELIFLKEPHISTSVFREAASKSIPMTGTDVDLILKGVNAYLMALAEKQIKIAFEQAQAENDYRNQRIKEGIETARLAGKQIGRSVGTTTETKKAKAAKATMLQHSKDFGGSLNDIDCMKLTGLSRNTYYKYKKQLKERGQAQKGDSTNEEKNHVEY